MASFIDIGEHERLYVEDKGLGQNLVCMHGLGGGAYFFSDLSLCLRERNRVVAFDLPGTGFSRYNDRAFCIERCVDTTTRLIEQELDSPVTLLGHSMGTIIAMLVYMKSPQLVNRMIFCGGIPEPLPELQETLSERARQVKQHGMNGVAEMAKPIIFSETSRRRKAGMVAMYCRLLESNDANSYAESAAALARASAKNIVSQIRVPCLLMTGSEDRYAPPEAVTRFVDEIPSETEYHVFPDCGHMLFFENPDKFNNTIEEFLRKSNQ